MEIVFLGVVFAVIIGLLALRRPLYQSVLGGLIVTAILYRMPVSEIFGRTADVFKSWSSMAVIVSLYLITYLQRMLEARGQIKLAQEDLNGLCHNRRINATAAPLFIGLLPSAAAMILCGDIVKDTAKGHLTTGEQAFVACWFRHIPESSLPTYSSVLLLATLSGLPIADFMVSMVIPFIVLIIIGWWPYVHRIPKDPGTPKSKNRLKDAVNLAKHLWTIIAVLVLILAFGISVVPAVGITIVLAAFVYKFSPQELLEMLKSAFEPKLLINTFLVLVLKEFIAFTGVLEMLPDMLSKLPIPTYLIFALLFFIGGIISGSAGIIALGTPLAFAALDGGIPLMMLLMCMCHASSMVSPTHVCVTIAADHFGITLGELIRRSIPASLIFAVLMVGYYNILILL